MKPTVDKLLKLPHCSAVLVYGETGTVFQRMFRTGKWHSTGGDVKTDEELAELPWVRILWVAPEE